MKKDKKEKKQKKDGETSRVYRVIYKIFAGIVGWIFNIRVKRREEESEKGRFIVCANHTSATDAIVICYAFKKHQVRYMAKKELFKIPVLAPLIKLLGAFPVDRGGNDVGAIRKAVDMVKEGKCMGIFPQGHRYPCVDPRDTKTKNGAALIATRAEADIIPAYIARKNNKFKLFRRTYVVIGERIPFSALNYNKDADGEYARITSFVFDKVCTLGEEFEKEQKAKKETNNKK
jgi:1-acyl-sn-glycerol-3-phosphate acyltransferase